MARDTLAVTGVWPSVPSLKQEPPRFGAGQGFFASSAATTGLTVPPFAAGNVPVTAVVKPILPHEGAVDVPPDISAFPVATSARFEIALLAFA